MDENDFAVVAELERMLKAQGWYKPRSAARSIFRKYAVQAAGYIYMDGADAFAHYAPVDVAAKLLGYALTDG